jgi:hypothetical protein
MNSETNLAPKAHLGPMTACHTAVVSLRQIPAPQAG